MQGATRFDHLKKLELFERQFRYGRNTYNYADVEHIRAFSTSQAHKLHGRVDGISHRAYLELTISGKKLKIAQKRTWFGYDRQDFAAAVMQAAAALGGATFYSRMARYEKQLATRGYVEWGPYHLFANGDLRKHGRLCFNLWGPGVSLRMPEPLKVTAVGRPAAWWGRWFGRVEEIDIATDRDCFLYLMKHTYGFSWPKVPVYDKPEAPKGAGATGGASPRPAQPGARPAGPQQEQPKPPPPTPTHVDDLVVLGLPDGAVWAEIRKAYLKLAMRHHPDRLQAQGVSEQEMARSQEILKNVNVAYGRLEVRFGPRAG